MHKQVVRKVSHDDTRSDLDPDLILEKLSSYLDVKQAETSGSRMHHERCIRLESFGDDLSTHKEIVCK